MKSRFSSFLKVQFEVYFEKNKKMICIHWNKINKAHFKKLTKWDCQENKKYIIIAK